MKRIYYRSVPWLPAAMLGGLLCTIACNEETPPQGDNEGETSGGIDITATDSSDPPSTESVTDSSNDETTGDSDTASGSTSGDPTDTFACNRVDFIFVVDNSISMQDEQQFLVQGVPGFVEAMQNALPISQGFRVGVIDTDAYPALGVTGDPLDGCPEDGSAECGSCDYTLGAFLQKPQSAADPTSSCEFSTGLSYMDGLSENFGNEFACAALVGAEGNPIEQQAGALVAAVSEDLNGSCNDDFMRDNALLVFLIISDEEDDHTQPPDPQGGSQGDPQEWYDAIVAAKDGKPDNVVALGLMGGSPKFGDCADLSEGLNGAEQSSRLVNLVERFPTNAVGSVCSEGYGSFFQDALDKVAQGCMNFIP